MSPGEFYVKRWSVWSPGLNSFDAWSGWAASGSPLEQTAVRLPASFVPALLRRRCSNFTRAALEAAYAVLEDGEHASVETVFASRHGEGEITTTILRQLASRELLSPNDFSLSVHNTASGLFSIFGKNTAPSTAVAAAYETLDAGLFEMQSSLLRSKGERDVLLIIADMPCPSVFGELGVDPAFAIALLCSAEKTDPAAVHCRMRWERGPDPAKVPQQPGAVAFLRWIFTDHREFDAEHDGSHFRIVRDRADWRKLFRETAGGQPQTSEPRPAAANA